MTSLVLSSPASLPGVGFNSPSFAPANSMRRPSRGFGGRPREQLNYYLQCFDMCVCVSVRVCVCVWLCMAIFSVCIHTIVGWLRMQMHVFPRALSTQRFEAVVDSTLSILPFTPQVLYACVCVCVCVWVCQRVCSIVAQIYFHHVLIFSLA